MVPNIRRLSYIVAVAQHGSLAEASEKLNISPSAISVAVKDCEDELGFRIFLRKPSQALTLTPVGRRFIAETRRFLDQVSAYGMQAKGLTGQPTGRLDIGCFFPLASYLMLDAVQAMQEQFPKISTHLHEGDLQEVLDSLRSGVTDLAVTYDMCLDPEIEFELLFEIKPAVLLSSRNRLATKKNLHIRDLVDQPMILIDLPIQQAFMRSLFSNYDLHPKVGHRVRLLEFARNMVGADWGYTIVWFHPENVATHDGSPLTCRTLADDLPTTRVVLAKPSQATDYPATDEFRKVCRSLFIEQRVMDKYLPYESVSEVAD